MSQSKERNVVIVHLKVTIAFKVSNTDFLKLLQCNLKIMGLKKRLTKFVEKKLERVIEMDLKKKFKDDNNFFDVKSYADELFSRYFPDEETDNLKSKIIDNEIINNEPMNSLNVHSRSTETEDYSQGSSELDVREFYNFSSEEITINLQSDFSETRLQCLKELEICAEDLINQPFWDAIKKILLGFLENEIDRKTQILTLKIFQKFLQCFKKPQLVCEAFICLAEVVMIRLEIFNSNVEQHSADKVLNNFNENKWENKCKSSESIVTNKDECQIQNGLIDSEILLKSMVLLIKCQRQMPGKWIRFNGKRLKDIIIAFVQLLSSTTASECDKLSGLELISILNPKGNWCRHWCHTAIGRSLFCSALKKYKTFFTHTIEIILTNLRKKRNNYLLPTINNPNLRDISPRYLLKHKDTICQTCKFSSDWKKQNDNHKCHLVHSAPISKTRENSGKGKNSVSKYLIENIPKKVIEQAVFCHNFSLVVFLIQYRSGRSLFPIKTSMTKRLLSVQDLVTSMTSYIQNFEQDHESTNRTMITPAYREHMSDLLEILKNVQSSLYKRSSAIKPS